MSTLLYALAVLSPLLIAGASAAMIWVRWIERRAEDRLRAEHGLPARVLPDRTRIEDVEARSVAARARRRVADAFDPDATAPSRRARAAAHVRETPTTDGVRPPWPLDDLEASPEDVRVARKAAGDTAPTVRRAQAAGAPATAAARRAAPTPAPTHTVAELPATPARDDDGARAAIARAAATLEELERAADRADRYGTKDCPSCEQSVRVSARVCPHCRHRMAPEPERRDVTAA